MPTRGQGVAAMRAERPHLLPRALPPPRVLWTLSRSQTLRAPHCSLSWPLSSPLLASAIDGRAELAAAAVLAAPSFLTPHEHHPQLRRHLLHAVLMLAVQNHAGSTAVAGRRRFRPPVLMAGPPQTASRPSKTTSECGRTPWCSSSTSPPPLSLLRPDSASPDDLPVQNPVRDLALKFD